MTTLKRSIMNINTDIPFYLTKKNIAIYKIANPNLTLEELREHARQLAFTILFTGNTVGYFNILREIAVYLIEHKLTSAAIEDYLDHQLLLNHLTDYLTSKELTEFNIEHFSPVKVRHEGENSVTYIDWSINFKLGSNNLNIKFYDVLGKAVNYIPSTMRTKALIPITEIYETVKQLTK